MILLYGSHLLKTNPDRHSAFDFVVVVEAYRPFYAALKRSGELHRPASLLTWLADVLPPNVIAFAPGEGREGIAKCLVVSREHFSRALGSDPPDHFILGRMIQKVGTVWTATSEDAEWVESQLQAGRRRVLDWMAPYLGGPFDAESLGRRMLEVCYQGELRPEAENRAEKIFEAQAAHFREQYAEVLRVGEANGVLRREGSGFVLARPATPSARARWQRHFRRSKRRATARWLKHTVTFANWLPYVVRKVERHTGRRIELTRLERRLPLIFLWPRVVKVLMTRPPRETLR